MRVIIASSVGGGPMERLARSLASLDLQAEVAQSYTPERWRHHLGRGKWGRLRARLSAFVLYPFAALWTARRARRSHAGPVFCVPTTNPFFLPFLFVVFRRYHGCPVVPLVYDLYPDALEAAGLASGGGLLSRAMARANRYLFRRCDGAVFIGEGMARHSVSRYGEPPRWVVIETGADARGEFGAQVPPSDSDLALSERARTLLEWCGHRLVLSYVGNMGHLHDWETLAGAVERLAGCAAVSQEGAFLAPGASGTSSDTSTAGAAGGVPSPQNLAVVVAASGPGVDNLRRRWRDLPSSMVRFEGPLDDQTWAALLRRSGVALVTLGNGAARTSIPSKAFSAMAAGNALCVVAPVDSDVAQVVRDNGAGEVVVPGDVDGLVSTLSRLSQSPAALESYRSRAREAALERYDVANLALRWKDFLASVPEHVRSPQRAGGISFCGRVLKRVVDLMGASAGLLFLSPLLLLIALLVRARMGSPVIFTQTRPGLHGRPFRIFKFRTMRQPRPGEEGPDLDQERMTGLGRFLRNSSLDELPELFNVLRGEMSLVGPRPLLMRYLARYTPQQARRHVVKPGITGWAQVNGRNNISWGDKFRLDTHYVDSWSLWLDLVIILRTVGKVIRRDDISREGHATMPEFMGGEE